jgi:hypothetical protein
MLLVTSVCILQDTVAYSLNNTEGVTASQICGITLQAKGCLTGQSSLQWSVDVDPGPKPEINTANSSKAHVRASIYVTYVLLIVHHSISV